MLSAAPQSCPPARQTASEEEVEGGGAAAAVGSNVSSGTRGAPSACPLRKVEGQACEAGVGGTSARPGWCFVEKEGGGEMKRREKREGKNVCVCVCVCACVRCVCARVCVCVCV